MLIDAIAPVAREGKLTIVGDGPRCRRFVRRCNGRASLAAWNSPDG
jgi:hypothetical protein